MKLLLTLLMLISSTIYAETGFYDVDHEGNLEKISVSYAVFSFEFSVPLVQGTCFIGDSEDIAGLLVPGASFPNSHPKADGGIIIKEVDSFETYIRVKYTYIDGPYGGSKNIDECPEV
jgi:hypothetical protein